MLIQTDKREETKAGRAEADRQTRFDLHANPSALASARQAEALPPAISQGSCALFIPLLNQQQQERRERWAAIGGSQRDAGDKHLPFSGVDVWKQVGDAIR